MFDLFYQFYLIILQGFLNLSLCFETFCLSLFLQVEHCFDKLFQYVRRNCTMCSLLRLFFVISDDLHPLLNIPVRYSFLLQPPVFFL